jgi:hypothetical protein
MPPELPERFQAQMRQAARGRRSTRKIEMGAWGTASFDDDDAMDWLDDAQSDGAPLVAALPQRVAGLEPSSAIDLMTASDAVAAAELVACALGHCDPDLPEGGRSG